METTREVFERGRAEKATRAGKPAGHERLSGLHSTKLRLRSDRKGGEGRAEQGLRFNGRVGTKRVRGHVTVESAQRRAWRGVNVF